MATFTGAISAIAQFMVRPNLRAAGIRNSYDTTELPESLVRPKWPCAIVVPQFEGTGNLRNMTFQGGATRSDFSVTQLVFWAAAAEVKAADVFGSMTAFMDAYFLEVRDNPFYWDKPAGNPPPVHGMNEITFKFEQGAYAKIDFHTIAMTHKVMINL